ncbi:DUF4340 domain-containing protein [Litorilinea aerophila]|nr:DUF4340 domain-containing protein [Litorilinea aerophila]MCC9077134.1 DUF4340 domain-containing protein [Litorilinea aerophila]
MAGNVESVDKRSPLGRVLRGGGNGDVLLYGLTGLLVIQLVLAVVMLWPRSATVDAGQPLFPDLTQDNVVALTIAGEDDTQVTLRKAEDGSWVMPDRGDFPVKADKVTTLIDKLMELKTNRLVAKNAASYERLSVADNQFIRRIDLELSDGSQHTLYLGTAPRVAATHVRRGDQAEVYLAANLRSYDAGNQPRDWIDTIYFSAPREEIVAMTLTNANGELHFTKNAGAWTLEGLQEGEEFNENNLASMITTLTGLNMVEPLGKEAKAEYGLDEPTAVIQVTTQKEDEEPQTHTLTIGAKSEDGRYYVMASSDSPYYVYVSEYTVERFVERGRADFIKQPEATPEATPASTPEATPVP